MSEAARINLVDRAPLTEKQQNVYESIRESAYIKLCTVTNCYF